MRVTEDSYGLFPPSSSGRSAARRIFIAAEGQAGHTAALTPVLESLPAGTEIVGASGTSGSARALASTALGYKTGGLQGGIDSAHAFWAATAIAAERHKDALDPSAHALRAASRMITPMGMLNPFGMMQDMARAGFAAANLGACGLGGGNLARGFAELLMTIDQEHFPEGRFGDQLGFPVWINAVNTNTGEDTLFGPNHISLRTLYASGAWEGFVPPIRLDDKHCPYTGIKVASQGLYRDGAQGGHNSTALKALEAFECHPNYSDDFDILFVSFALTPRHMTALEENRLSRHEDQDVVQAAQTVHALWQRYGKDRVHVVALNVPRSIAPDPFMTDRATVGALTAFGRREAERQLRHFHRGDMVRNTASNSVVCAA